MNRYIISIPANRDLEEISSYFLTTNIAVGERILRSFNQKCKQLISFPGLGRKRDDLSAGLRGLLIEEGYTIFYRITDDGIKIVRVLSGKRDLKALFANFEE